MYDGFEAESYESTKIYLVRRSISISIIATNVFWSLVCHISAHCILYPLCLVYLANGEGKEMVSISLE